MSQLVEIVKEKVQELFAHDTTGHDWFHIERVLKVAEYLQSKEGGNLELIQLAALLHDISDHKMNGGVLNAGGQVAFEMLVELGYDETKATMVKEIVDGVSYKGAHVQDVMTTVEGKIVQDADRLDAIGAIGIARAFAFGGSKNRPMYIPDYEPKMHTSFEEYASSKSHTVNHFYEKLLLLEARLHTETAKQIGKERHTFMEQFLEQFYNEWNSKLN
ncbi:MAG: HD domain-containing protein [Crocinitomicaceae bacterium]|nr:MAG: HD domain-containing protein [Crocinitomicaceae bacterium]